MGGYVELHAHSAYSFLDGASQPEELAARASELGYGALALTDHDGVYGSLEFAHAAKAFGVRAITGAEVTLEGGAHITLLVESRRGYANLCRLLTTAHAETRRVGREDREPLPPAVPLETVAESTEGLVCLSGCARRGLGLLDPNAAVRLAGAFGPDRFYVELQRPFERGDTRRLTLLRDLAEHLGVETVATGDIHSHHPRRTLLQDVLVAIRCRTSLEGCEPERRGNRESYLRSPEEMLERFSFDRAAAERSTILAERLEFDLTEELGYSYPDFSDGEKPAIRQLAAICHAAVSERYQGERVASPARRRLDSELALIDELGLAGFFLLHHEVLEIARECAREVRGDGLATRVPAAWSRSWLLSGFDRLLPHGSLARRPGLQLSSRSDGSSTASSPPFRTSTSTSRATSARSSSSASPSATGASTPHSSRASRRIARRGAIRDVGKALGLPFAELERLARTSDGWSAKRVGEEVARLPDGERKLESKRWRAFAWLTGEISGLPRHVSQHPGGMIVSTRPLIELVPVQPAAMAGRQLCQWDKDSCSDAGFLKIDLLGLGMLSAVEDCVEQIARTHDEVIDLSRIPFDDEAVYDDIQRADTIGTFQIESRAQMQSLLRTKPANLDDITVQVALVRPGPIQGKAVHPYIDARQRLREDPSYVFPVDHEFLREPLRSTFGVVVFQDQVLEVAIALAGFTVGEAEGLRRAMSRKRSHDALEAFRGQFVAGAAEKGVEAETADTVFDKLVGFSGFGFPKAHAAAFGLLAYQSTWLRHYYPAEFLCALLNEQPMGFYPPATLVRDAQRHGVEVLPVDVNLSGARCVVEWEAVRIGLSYISAIGKDEAETLVSERDANGPYRDVADLARRSRLSQDGLEALVKGGACDGFWKPRRDLLWELGLVFRAQSVPGTDGEMKQLPARARAHDRDARAPRSHALGAHARGLPPHEHVDRDASAVAPARAPPARNALEHRAPRGTAQDGRSHSPA